MITVQSVGLSGWTNGLTHTSTVAKPSGLQVGEILLAHCSYMNGPTPPGEFYMIPSDGIWNTLYEEYYAGTADGISFGLYWKKTTSADVALTNFTFTRSGLSGGSNNNKQVALWRISGADKIDPFTPNDDQDTGNNNPTVSGIFSLKSGSVIGIIGSQGGDPASSASGYYVTNNNPSWTEAYDSYTTNGNDATMVGAYSSSYNFDNSNTGISGFAWSGGSPDTFIVGFAINPADPIPADIEDSMTISDTNRLMLTVLASIQETLSLSDMASATYGKFASIVDSIGLTDIISKFKELWDNPAKSGDSWYNSSKSSSNINNQSKGNSSWSDTPKSQ